jgi:hypothetical protein
MTHESVWVDSIAPRLQESLLGSSTNTMRNAVITGERLPYWEGSVSTLPMATQCGCDFFSGVQRRRTRLTRPAPLSFHQRFMQHGLNVSLVRQPLLFRLLARQIEVRFHHPDGDVP